MPHRGRISTHTLRSRGQVAALLLASTYLAEGWRNTSGGAGDLDNAFVIGARLSADF